MEAVIVRLLPFDCADGATNMACDEALVRSAAAGIASLRFYTWTTATVSLGYFQPYAVYRNDPMLRRLPCVRRPSGGATLVHHHELTYALALPAGHPWQTGESWLLRMHRIIVTALGSMGLAEMTNLVERRTDQSANALCFQQFTVGDVLCAGKKVVGSAQRKYHQAIMQHGSILLAQSEHTPSLPGISELTGLRLELGDLQSAIIQELTTRISWQVQDSAWTGMEQEWIDELVKNRYRAADWNERR